MHLENTPRWNYAIVSTEKSGARTGSRGNDVPPGAFHTQAE